MANNIMPISFTWLRSLGGLDYDINCVAFRDWLVFSFSNDSWKVFSVTSSHWQHLCTVATRDDVVKLFDALKFDVSQFSIDESNLSADQEDIVEYMKHALDEWLVLSENSSFTTKLLAVIISCQYKTMLRILGHEWRV